MSDRTLRDLERSATAGDVQAQNQFGLELLRAGRGRDPRKTPREGDVVRICVPGSLDRWDEREVTEVTQWKAEEGDEFPNVLGDELDDVHWSRTERSLEQLRRWGNVWQSNVMCVRSWRGWCRKSQQGEVVRVAYNPPEPELPVQIPLYPELV